MKTFKKTDNWPVIALALGMLLYIAVDSGFFKGLNFRSFSSQNEISLSPEQQEIASLKKELSEVKSLVLQKREKIHGLLKNLDSIDQNISTETKEIGQLEKRLPKKEERKPAQNLSRTIKNIDTGIEFSSWSELISLIQKDSRFEFTIEPIVADGNNLLKFNQDSSFSEDSIYMRHAGLKMARIVAESVLKLGADTIQLSYIAEDKLTEQRLNVLKRYLTHLVGDSVHIEVQKIASGIENKSGIEVRVKLKNG